MSDEPWKTDGEWLHDATGDLLIGLDHHWLKDEHLRRIAACVNACKGFTTEQLEAAARGEGLCVIGSSEFMKNHAKVREKNGNAS